MKLVINSAELITSAIIDTALNDAACAPAMLEVMREARSEVMQAALADWATIMPIIGVPATMSSDPERYVDEIFDEALGTLMREDALTTSMHDWRKGRGGRGNGWVVQTLKAHGRSAPVNQRVVEIALRIEAGKLMLRPENVDFLTEGYSAA